MSLKHSKFKWVEQRKRIPTLYLLFGVLVDHTAERLPFGICIQIAFAEHPIAWVATVERVRISVIKEEQHNEKSGQNFYIPHAEISAQVVREVFWLPIVMMMLLLMLILGMFGKCVMVNWIAGLKRNIVQLDGICAAQKRTCALRSFHFVFSFKIIVCLKVSMIR